MGALGIRVERPEEIAPAMEKALEAHHLINITFGIQNVYTVSETLCGVKEWLETALEEATASIALAIAPTNIDDLNVGSQG